MRGKAAVDISVATPIFGQDAITKNMPLVSVIILLALWLIGEVTDHTFGGLLHILFLIALVVYGIILFAEKRGPFPAE